MTVVAAPAAGAGPLEPESELFRELRSRPAA